MRIHWGGGGGGLGHGTLISQAQQNRQVCVVVLYVAVVFQSVILQNVSIKISIHLIALLLGMGRWYYNVYTLHINLWTVVYNYTLLAL